MKNKILSLLLDTQNKNGIPSNTTSTTININWIYIIIGILLLVLIICFIIKKNKRK